MDKLKEKLASLTAESEPKDIALCFDEVAEMLLNEYVIRKGEELYRMTNVEFYFFNQHHPDVITYPRTCEAGMWFFHSSGVDLTFASDCKSAPGAKPTFCAEGAFYGGILIRGIRNVRTGEDLKGPYLSCDRLFDKFDAMSGSPADFPHLERVVLSNEKLLPKKERHNVSLADKKEEDDARRKKASSILSRFGVTKKSPDYGTIHTKCVEDYKAFESEPYQYSL